MLRNTVNAQMSGVCKTAHARPIATRPFGGLVNNMSDFREHDALVKGA